MNARGWLIGAVVALSLWPVGLGASNETLDTEAARLRQRLETQRRRIHELRTKIRSLGGRLPATAPSPVAGDPKATAPSPVAGGAKVAAGAPQRPGTATRLARRRLRRPGSRLARRPVRELPGPRRTSASLLPLPAAGKPAAQASTQLAGRVPPSFPLTGGTVNPPASPTRHARQPALQHPARGRKRPVLSTPRRPSRPLAPAPAPAPVAEWPVAVMTSSLYGILTLLGVYALRHYSFTINRLFGIQRHPYFDVDTADWPAVTVLVAAGDDGAAIARSLEALLAVEYPQDRLHIMPVSDRSTHRARQVVEDFAQRFPGRIHPFHRLEGPPGKAAVLKDAAAHAGGDILLLFDAGAVPGKGLIKQLAAPFFDPEVGSVIGRAVPWNVDSNLLTRLLDLERSGGCQVDQQARMNMELGLQHGGAVSGIRRGALESIGGLRGDAAAGDMDLACRLLLQGWKTVYQNRSECYETVPENWTARVRQVALWAAEHNRALARYGLALARSRHASLWERCDGLLQLGTYAASTLLVIGWGLALGLLCLGAAPFHAILGLVAVTCYGGLGNFPTVFQVAAAARLDGHRRRIRLLPLTLLSHVVHTMAALLAITGVLRPERRPAASLGHPASRLVEDTPR